MAFATVYPLYLQKVERRGHTQEELDQVICWLTGYTQAQLRSQIERGVDFETFFAEAPQINPEASKLKGSICGYRVEEIEEQLMREIRYLDLLVDRLAKSKVKPSAL